MNVATRMRWVGRVRRDRLLAFSLVSVVFWMGWVGLRTPCHPAGDLSCGLYSDHYSHMNTARLFVSKGVSIWTKPLADAGRPLTPEEFASLPADLREGIGGPDPSKAVATLPGWPEDKPFVSTWANYPRFHPPGNMLLTAPAALLYSFTGLSFTGANKLLIILFVLYAHAAFYAFVKAGQLESWAKPVGFAAAAIVYSELIHWSLEGFYEATVLLPLVLSARFLAQRRGIESLLAFSVAAVLHFRAFFFAPLAVYAFYLIVRERQWRGWGRRQHVQLIAVAILSGISLGIFTLVSPYFGELNIYNPLTLDAEPVNTAAIKAFLVVIVVLAGALAASRAWLDVAILVWVSTMLLFMHQAYEWEIVSFFAWLGAPVLVSARERASSVREVRLVATLFIAVFVFHNSLMPFWIQTVVA